MVCLIVADLREIHQIRAWQVVHSELSDIGQAMPGA